MWLQLTGERGLGIGEEEDDLVVASAITAMNRTAIVIPAISFLFASNAILNKEQEVKRGVSRVNAHRRRQ